MKQWWNDKAKPWLKWVLGGLLLILAGILAFGAYKRKVGTLKDKLKVEKALSDIKVLETKRDAHIATEAKLADKDARLAAKQSDIEVALVKAKKKVVAVDEIVEGRSDAEVVDRFNELFPR